MGTLATMGDEDIGIGGVGGSAATTSAVAVGRKVVASSRFALILLDSDSGFLEEEEGMKD